MQHTKFSTKAARTACLLMISAMAMPSAFAQTVGNDNVSVTVDATASGGGIAFGSGTATIGDQSVSETAIAGDPSQIAKPSTPAEIIQQMIVNAGENLDHCSLESGDVHRHDQRQSLPADEYMTTVNHGNFSEFLFGFRALGGTSSSIDISGTIALPAAQVLPRFEEDNGSIPLAIDLDIAPGNAVTVEGEIGDGPHGMSAGATGDFDFYALRNLTQGQRVFLRTEAVASDVIGYNVEVFNSTNLERIDVFPFLQPGNGEFIVPADGDYFFAVKDYLENVFILDPYDSASGFSFTFGEPLNPLFREGNYALTIGVDYAVKQEYRFFAKPGFVVSGALTSSAENLVLTLDDAEERQRIGSNRALFLPSPKAPYPTGDVEIAHVTDKFGIYSVTVTATSNTDYSLKLRADLPPLSELGKRRSVQTIYLDFDGATIAANTFEKKLDADLIVPGISEGLAQIGLTDADEEVFVDTVIRTVKQQIKRDIKRAGISEQFNLVIKNSRDHKDKWGKRNVSRVVLTGMPGLTPVISEATLLQGIAPSLDIGNFDTEETALVLLEGFRSTGEFLNFGEEGSEAAKIARRQFIANEVATVVSHEIGHFLGNYHAVSASGDDERIMLARAREARATPGDDGIYGTDDDVKPSFGPGFIRAGTLAGLQNSASNIAFSNPDSRKRLWGFGSVFDADEATLESPVEGFVTRRTSVSSSASASSTSRSTTP